MEQRTNLKRSSFLLLISLVLLLLESGHGGVAAASLSKYMTYPKDSLQKDTLQTIGLKEVIVRSKQKIHELDREVYIPTASQKKTSIDGYDLLRNMSIPQIDVNIANNEVLFHGKPVTFVIDGHVVTNLNDVRQISPQDVLRIEYDDMPTGEYDQYDCVIAFFTKRESRGGRIVVSGQQGLNRDKGDYDVQARYFRQKSEHTIAYNDAYSYDGEAYMGQTETFTYPDGASLTKSIRTSEGVDKTRKQNLFYNYHYFSDSCSFNARVGYLFSLPHSRYGYLANYEGRINATTMSYERSEEKSRSPYASFSGTFKIGGGQTLRLQGTFDYSNNKYSYFYNEDATENINQTKEHHWYSRLRLYYVKDLPRQWKLTGSVNGIFENSHTSYLFNQSPVKGGLWYMENLYAIEASKKWERLFASLKGELSQVLYKIRGRETQSYYSPRVTMTAKYTFSPAFSMQYRGTLANSFPSLSEFTDVEQDIDLIQKRRGNPDLRLTEILGNILTVNYDVSHWSLYMRTAFYVSWRNWHQVVSYEDGYFVHSYVNDGNYLYLNPEIGISWSYRGLSVKSILGFEHYEATGNYGVTDTEWYDKTALSFSAKSFNLGLYYIPFRHGVYGDLETWAQSAEYGASVSYKYKGVSLLVGTQNPFTRFRRWKHVRIQDYNLAQDRQERLEGKYFFMKLSLSLDMGGKKHDYTDIDMEKYTKSAILKGGVSK